MENTVKNAIRDRVYPFVLFFISPVLTLVLAFKEYKSNWAMNILWLFVAYFTANISRIEPAWDISRYIASFEEMYKMNMSFVHFVTETFETSADFIQPLINFLVSKITGNYRVLLAVYGLVYGFFYSRNVFTFLGLFRGELNRVTVFLVVSASFIIGVMEVNGFRYYSATHIFIYGVAEYFIYKRKRSGWLFVMITPLMHFSFFVNVAFFAVGVILMKNQLRLAMILFVLSNFASNLGVEKLLPQEAMPEKYQSKYKSYVGKDRIDYAKSQEQSYELNGYVGWPKQYANYFLYGTLILLYLCIFYWREEVPDKEMLAAALLMGALANVAASNSASGARLINIYYLFLYLYLFKIKDYLFKNSFYYKILNIYSFFFLLPLVVLIRTLFDYLGFATFFGGPFVRFLFNEDTPIIDGFKAVFPSF